MKKASSATLRRGWPTSDLSERFVPVPPVSVEPQRVSRRSRSEKDYRSHKHSKPHRHPPQYMCQSPPAYVQPGIVHQQIKAAEYVVCHVLDVLHLIRLNWFEMVSEVIIAAAQ
ncbi:unnamed protein product [Arctogadus glacialis]